MSHFAQLNDIDDLLKSLSDDEDSNSDDGDTWDAELAEKNGTIPVEERNKAGAGILDTSHLETLLSQLEEKPENHAVHIQQTQRSHNRRENTHDDRALLNELLGESHDSQQSHTVVPAPRMEAEEEEEDSEEQWLAEESQKLKEWIHALTGKGASTLASESVHVKGSQSASAAEPSRSMIKHDDPCMAVVAQDMRDSWLLSQVGTSQMVKFRESRFVALGTSYGLVLLYDLWRAQRVAIMGTRALDERGRAIGVTALAFGSLGSNVLAAGYSNGEVTLWNLEDFKPFKATLPDYFEAAIRHVEFFANTRSTYLAQAMQEYSVNESGVSSTTTDSAFPMVLFASDGARSMLFTICKKAITISVEWTSLDLSTVLRTRMLTMRGLPIGEGEHPMNRFSIAAIVTAHGIAITMLHPKMELIFTLEKSYHETEEKPCLSWRRSVLLDGRYANLRDIPPCSEPLLAVTWGDTLQVVIVNVDNSNKPMATLVGQGQLPFIATGVCWLSQHAIGVYGAHNGDHFAIIDAQSLEIVECATSQRGQGIEDAEISFCSDTLYMYQPGKYVADARFFQSTPVHIHRSGNTPLIEISHPHSSMFATLGPTLNARTFIAKSWRERIHSLTQISAWRDAFNLAIDLYHGRGRAVVGLATHGEHRRELVSKVISGLLDRYCDLTISTTQQKDKKKVYEQVGRMCLDYALQISDLAIFDRLYAKFASQQQQDTFISLLLPFILAGRLVALNNRTLFDAFIDYHVNRNELDVLEQCLIRMRIDSTVIDFDKFCTMCISQMRNDALIRAYLYAHNVVKGQYVEPLRQLLEGGSFKYASQRRIDIIFEYLFNCIQGGTYSNVDRLTAEQSTSVKRQILHFIFEKSTSAAAAAQYPILQLLLNKNPQKLFCVISEAFEDSTPTSPWRTITTTTSSSETLDGNAQEEALSKDDIAHVFVSLMADRNVKSGSSLSVDKRNTSWPLDHLIHFYSFLVANIARGHITRFDMKLAFRAVAHLAADTACDDKIRRERQEHIISILFQRRSEQSSAMMQDLIRICENSPCKLNMVAIFLHKQLHDYNSAIRCYLKDNTIRSDVFNYLEDIYNEDIHLELRNAVMNHLLELMRVNAAGMTRLIMRHFDTDHQFVMDVLYEMDSRALYEYLKNITIMSREIRETDLSSLSTIEMGEEEQVTHVKLMCQFEPQKVYDYLTTVQAFSDGSKLDAVLETCRSHNIQDAVSFLLERKGEIGIALQFILREMEEKIHTLKKSLFEWSHTVNPNNKGDGDDALRDGASDHWISIIIGKQKQKIFLPLVNDQPVYMLPEAVAIEEQLCTAIKMCQRNTERKTQEEEDVQRLWFDLMDFFGLPLKQLRNVFLNKELPHDGDGKSRDLKRIENERGKCINMIANCQKRLDQFQQHLDDSELDDSEEEASLDSRKEKNEKLIAQLERKLEDLDEQERLSKEEQAREKENPFANKNLPRLANLWLQSVYHRFIQQTISAMIRSIPLPSVISKVISDNINDGFAGQMRDTIFHLLSLNHHEHEMLDVVNSILEDDTFSLVRKYTERLSRGLRTTSTTCDKCHRSIQGGSDVVRMFGCGHAFHLRCVGPSCHHCPIDSSRSLTRQHRNHVTNQLSMRSRIDQAPTLSSVSSLTPLSRLTDLEQLLDLPSKYTVLQGIVSNEHAESPNRAIMSQTPFSSLAPGQLQKMENPNANLIRQPAGGSTSAVNTGSCQVLELFSDYY